MVTHKRIDADSIDPLKLLMQRGGEPRELKGQSIEENLANKCVSHAQVVSCVLISAKAQTTRDRKYGEGRVHEGNRRRDVPHTSVASSLLRRARVETRLLAPRPCDALITSMGKFGVRPSLPAFLDPSHLCAAAKNCLAPFE